MGTQFQGTINGSRSQWTMGHAVRAQSNCYMYSLQPQTATFCFSNSAERNCRKLIIDKAGRTRTLANSHAPAEAGARATIVAMRRADLARRVSLMRSILSVFAMKLCPEVFFIPVERVLVTPTNQSTALVTPNNRLSHTGVDDYRPTASFPSPIPFRP